MQNMRIIACLVTICCLYSCNFRIVEEPGPQWSSSIKYAKEIKTYICSYKIPGDTINGDSVECIFAERQYSYNGNKLGSYDISSNESQLEIVFKYPISKEDNEINYERDWKLDDFKNLKSDRMIYRNYEKVLLPDSIQLKITTNIRNKPTTKNLTLYKVKQ